MAETPSPSYPISSVDNALRLLLLVAERSEVRTSEAALALGVGRSTAHRLLAMLQHRGLVEQDPQSKAFRVGPALVGIGLSAVRGLDVRVHLLGHMQRLRDEVNETVQLMILDGADCLFLDAIEADRPLRTSSRVGRRLPAHCTSGGQALLAELSIRELRDLLPTRTLPVLTPNSPSSRTALEDELRQVRERGYALNLGASEPDIGAVGAVVRDGLGRPRAALAVSMPLSRVGPSTLEAISVQLKVCTSAASLALV